MKIHDRSEKLRRRKSRMVVHGAALRNPVFLSGRRKKARRKPGK